MSDHEGEIVNGEKVPCYPLIRTNEVVEVSPAELAYSRFKHILSTTKTSQEVPSVVATRGTVAVKFNWLKHITIRCLSQLQASLPGQRIAMAGKNGRVCYSLVAKVL